MEWTPLVTLMPTNPRWTLKYECMYTCIHAYIHTYTCIRAYVHMYMYVIYVCLDLLPLLPLLFGIAFHLQLVLLSYHPSFLSPYHFLKLVTFLGANRTKSASVCLWLLGSAIQILEYNTK